MSPDLPDVPAAYPVRDRRIWSRTHAAWALALGLPTLALYIYALAPAVGWWDSGELLACAKSLSVAHRPGFPLYVILGRVGFGATEDPRLLANLFSAFSAACALVCLWRALCLLSGDRAANRLWAALGGLLVAACPLYFRQAIRIEVYAPAYAACAVALLLAAAAQKAPDPRAAGRRFLCSAYVLALAFGFHSAVTAPLALAVAALFILGDFRPSFSQWSRAAIVFALGLSVHLYVPLRTQLAPYVWGAPHDLSGFLSYLTAADAHGVIAREAQGTLSRVRELWDVVSSQASLVLVAFGAAGVVWSGLRESGRGSAPLWLATGGLAVAATVVSHVIPDNADMHAYLVPVLWALWWGWCQLEPSGWALQTRAWQRHAALALVLLAASAVCVQVVQAWQAVRHTRLALSDAWGARLLEGARPGDLIIVGDVNTDFLLRGLLETGTVPSVTVLNAALAEAPWYREVWESRHLAPSNDSAPWVRRVASAWRARGGRVLLDFGTPGFVPAEMAPRGMLCLWDTTVQMEPGIPQLRLDGAQADPEFVRSAVWFYYRLAVHQFAVGHADAARRACDEGLYWAPEEVALLEARAGGIEFQRAGAGEPVPGQIP